MQARVGVGSWGGSWTPAVRVVRTMRLMANRFRVAPVVALAVAAAALAARPAAAQRANGWGVTFYNADEIATDNLQLVLLGASASRRDLGVSPVVSAQGYWLHYGKSPADVTQWAFTPSAGLKLNFQGGALQGRLGYTFVNKEAGAGVFAPGGGKDGVTTTVQADYWDSGKGMGQAIVNYNWGAKTLWSRGRLGTRIAQTASGGSVGILGEAAYLRAKSSTPNVADYSVWQVGPGLSYNSPHGFGATLSGGAKLPNEGKKAGYIHLDMYLSR